MRASAPHTTAQFCRFLEWDTHYFKRRIGCILPTRLTREIVEQAREWAREDAIECLYFLPEASDRQTIGVAEANGLRFTDIRVTLECALVPEHGPVALSPGIRLCREDDVPALREIARVSHRNSRFYYGGVVTQGRNAPAKRVYQQAGFVTSSVKLWYQ